MAEPAECRRIAEDMATAALAWLDSLDEEQRRVVVGAVPADDRSDEERRRWFYTPTDHGGLAFHQQRPAQQRRAMRLVATGLSTAGYVTVATTIGLENILDHTEGLAARFDRERGRDPGLYYLRVFGRPGSDRPWGWRFGSHHVSLNNLVVGGELVATTPCFMGDDPASSPLLGGAVNRPLARMEAVEYSATAKGVPGRDLDGGRREVLRALLGTYLDRVPEGVAPHRDDASLDEMHVAGAGPLEPGRPNYYRLQGPRLLNERDNTQRGTNHAHSVWRDPTPDFGLDVLAAHHTEHH